jgi:prepilin-type processing-associated H-X9-DG protein
MKSPVSFYSWGMTAMLLPFMEQGNKFETIDFGAGSCHTHLLDLQARGAADPGSQPINMLLCPSDFRTGEKLLSGPTGPLPFSGDVGYLYPTNYLGMAGAGEDVDISNGFSACRGIPNGDGMFYTDKAVKFRDVLDGTSNTILFGERSLPDDLGWGWPLCGGDECEHYISAAAGFYMGNHIQSEYFLHLQHFWSWHEGGAHITMADGSVHFMSYSLDYQTYTNLATRAGSDKVDAAAWLP